MKTAIETLKEKGIEPRRVIFDVINHISVDYSKKITEEEKVLKIVLWHIGLSDTSQTQIMAGLRSLMNDSSEFPPNCGKFKKGCIRPPISNASEEPDHRPQKDPVLNKKEASAILKKLIGMTKK